MKKFLYVIIVVLFCSLLLSCGANEQTVKPQSVDQDKPKYEKFDEQDMQNKTLPDFGEILEYGYLMPKSSVSAHTLDEISKITYLSSLLYEYNYGNNFIAINLKEKKMFVDDAFPSEYLVTSDADYQMTDQDVQYVKDLIEEYEIKSWFGGYRGDGIIHCDPQPYTGYELVIQFDNATVFRSSGDNVDFKRQQEFEQKLVEFCRSKERNILQTFEQMEMEANWYEKPNDVVQKPEDITKIYYYEVGDGWIANEIYLDIKDKLVYYDETKSYKPLNNKQPTYIMSETESNEFVDIVEKYNILSWEGHHSGDVTGPFPYIGWVLILQFENCSLHVASGDEVNHEGQAEFVKEMRDLIMSKTPNIEG